MDVSSLSDEELNRAMIWLNRAVVNLSDYYMDDGSKVYASYFINMSEGWGKRDINYLTDWSLTGPLMIDNDINLSGTNKNHCANYGLGILGNYESSWNENPLRAICECRLMIYLATESQRSCQ